MLVWVCTKGDTCELSGELQTGTTSMENKMEITKKVKTRTTIQYSNSTSGKLSKGNENTKSKIYLHPKFRLKLKKARKITRSFMYDLNQIPYYYTVEVTNRFKGFGLIECLKNYGWRFMTFYRKQ